MRGVCLAVLLMLMTGTTVARAEVVQLFPVMGQVSPGVFQPELQVWRSGQLLRFRAVDGEITNREIRDERAAEAWVRERLGLHPRRDLVEYCPGGIPGVVCRLPPTRFSDW